MKLKGLRWWIIGLIALVTIINYIDRNALSIMWPEISKDLGMDKSDYANIVSIFMIAYAVSHTLSGRIYDWIGTRMGFLMSITVWSAGIILHGIARSVTSFSIFRFILGFGEAGNWPGATKSNAEWFPVKERAIAQGIFNAGSATGAIVSFPLIGFLFIWLGWRATFVVVGIAGMLWLIPWLVVNKSAPEKHPWLTKQERDLILSGRMRKDEDKNNQKVLGISGLLKYKQSYTVLFARFFIDPVWWMFLTWLPIFLSEKFDFNIKDISVFGWIPFVGGALGSLIGGLASGYLIGKGKSVDYARKLVVIVGGVLMLIPMILTAFSKSPLESILLITIILFGFQFAMGNIQTMTSDFFSGKDVGTLMGMSGTTSTLGVLIATQLVPLITKTSYVPFFIMGALLIPLGVLSVFIGGKIENINS